MNDKPVLTRPPDLAELQPVKSGGKVGHFSGETAPEEGGT